MVQGPIIVGVWCFTLHWRSQGWAFLCIAQLFIRFYEVDSATNYILSRWRGLRYATVSFFFGMAKAHGDQFSQKKIGGSCLGPQFSKTRDGSSKLCKVVDWSFASCPSCPSSWSRCDLWAPLMCSFSIMSMDSKYMWQRKWTSLEVYLDIPESIDTLFACKFEDSLIEFSLSPTELNARGHSQSPSRILSGKLDQLNCAENCFGALHCGQNRRGEVVGLDPSSHPTIAMNGFWLSHMLLRIYENQQTCGWM